MPFITNNEIKILLKQSGQDDDKIFLEKYKKIIKYLSDNPQIYHFESKTDHVDGMTAFIIKVNTCWAINVELFMKYIKKLEDE